MNQQKTGELIAKRRRELGLTQKSLADQLNISDRTVSKWERGLGFPDISLIESLAETLGITVVELLHGEECTPTAEAEGSIKEAIQAFCPEIQAQRKRSRVKFTAILVVSCLILFFSAAIILWSTKDVVGDETGFISIDAAEATAICPYIIITQQDLRLIDALLLDPRIQCNIDSTSLVTYDQAFVQEYIPYIDQYNMELTYVIIQASHGSVSVSYGTELTRIMLDIDRSGGIKKGIMQLDSPLQFLEDGTVDCSIPTDARYTVYNTDNSYFERKTYKTGFAALF